MMCLNIGHLKSINFPFGTNGKLMVLGVPILKHLRVHFYGETWKIISITPSSMEHWLSHPGQESRQEITEIVPLSESSGKT